MNNTYYIPIPQKPANFTPPSGGTPNTPTTADFLAFDTDQFREALTRALINTQGRYHSEQDRVVRIITDIKAALMGKK